MSEAMKFFDAMIECLKNEQAKSPRTTVNPEVLDRFYGTVAPPPKAVKSVPPPPPVQAFQAPAPPQAAPVNRPEPIPKPVFQRHKTLTPCPVDDLSMDELRLMCLNCRSCPLCAKRTNVVFGEGSEKTGLMFIGEGPGMDEDQQGRPFVGAAGQLLTKMIIAMQFRREDVYIGNIVKCRPPGNRVPLPEEANACLPYIRRQISLIQPKVIVLLGATPLQYILGQTGIIRSRGKWNEYQGIKVMPTFHPAYLLRNADAKRDVWNDLQEVMKVFGKAHRR